MKYKLLVINLCLLCISCQTKERQQTRELLQYYLAGLIFFETEMILHFPFEFEVNEIQEMEFDSPNSIKQGGVGFAMLRIKVDSVKYETVIANLNDSLGLTLIENDNNIVILPDSSDHLGLTNPLFIPDFKRLYDEHQSSFTEFQEKHKLLLIEQRKGIYIEADENIPPKPYLPEEWEHGYSKGIATEPHSRTIIYWLVIW